MQVSSDEIVFWYYQSNSRPSSKMLAGDVTIKEWTKYRDIEIDIIEEAYQEGRPYALLDRYRIDLINWIQIRLDNNEKQRPIKRETGQNRRKSLRENRFYCKPSMITNGPLVLSYGTFDSWCPFLRAWFETPKGIRAWFQLDSCIEAGAHGIIEEARIHNSFSNAEAAYVAEKLRQCTGRSRRQASEFCVYLYTKDSFLYDVLNTALRKSDISKVDTLGPIAFLISNYSHACNEFVGTVYRGVELVPSEIEAYKEAVGTWKSWPAYTSTSKNRRLAELYGSALFVIEISDIKLTPPRALDISNLSHYPCEDEVLLLPGTSFRVLEVAENAEKCIISIRI